MIENETPLQTPTRSAPERAVLVGIQRDSMTRQEAEESLAELERLFSDAGGCVLDTRTVQLRDPCAATLLSKGHVENLKLWIEASECDLVVFDDEVTAVQQRNLEKAFGCRVLTRTMVILDIFATHAQTREAMTQVELAQMRYFMPRLVGATIATAKMGGTSARIATRGPGETQLETDRRHARERIRRLEETLKTIVQHRRTQRQRRQRMGCPSSALSATPTPANPPCSTP
jgi:GTP-binding protein HflX